MNEKIYNLKTAEVELKSFAWYRYWLRTVDARTTLFKLFSLQLLLFYFNCYTYEKNIGQNKKFKICTIGGLISLY